MNDIIGAWGVGVGYPSLKAFNL